MSGEVGGDRQRVAGRDGQHQAGAGSVAEPVVGGTWDQLEVDTGRPGGINDLTTLAYLEKIRNYGKGLEGVSDAYAYSQVFTVLNHVWNGGDSAREELPNAAMMMLFRPLLAGQVPENALIHIMALLVTAGVAFAIALQLTRRRLLK